MSGSGLIYSDREGLAKLMELLNNSTDAIASIETKFIESFSDIIKFKIACTMCVLIRNDQFKLNQRLVAISLLNDSFRKKILQNKMYSSSNPFIEFMVSHAEQCYNNVTNQLYLNNTNSKFMVNKEHIISNMCVCIYILHLLTDATYDLTSNQLKKRNSSSLNCSDIICNCCRYIASDKCPKMPDLPLSLFQISNQNENCNSTINISHESSNDLLEAIQKVKHTYSKCDLFRAYGIPNIFTVGNGVKNRKNNVSIQERQLVDACEKQFFSNNTKVTCGFIEFNGDSQKEISDEPQNTGSDNKSATALHPNIETTMEISNNMTHFKELLGIAYDNPLTPPQYNELSEEMKKNPHILTMVKFSPVKNTSFAIECLIHILEDAQNNSGVDDGIPKNNAFLTALINEVEVSLRSIEVINRLANSTLKLPAEFYNLYISSCIAACENIQDKYMQNRMVRMVCAFMHSMIRNKVVHKSKELLVVVESFSLEFSKIKEAGALFRMLKNI